MYRVHNIYKFGNKTRKLHSVATSPLTFTFRIVGTYIATAYMMKTS